MSAPHPSPDDSLPLPVEERIDDVCLRFEDAWNRGDQPQPEAYLGDCAESERSALLREWLHLDVVFRRRAGPGPTEQEYDARFPWATEVIRAVFAAAVPLGPGQVGGDPGPDPSPAAPAPAEEGVPMGPPELIGHPRYHVLGLLGAGGMGAVYKALHRPMERQVALKVISPKLMGDAGAVARFRREVKAAARLSHPNIVAAYDAEHAGDLHFLVMEYVEGQSLAALVEDKGPLPVAEACDYVRQAALGLQHAHEHGMVHRDIKPHNLMLTAGGVVKILDFGLARVGGPAEAGATLTQAGVLMGTPDYMAPEQASSPHAADIRADIYALGCTLYFLLTGRPPFPKGTLVQKLADHLERTPPPLAAVRSDVPAELSRLVERMLAKDPAQRYQTPGEVAQVLALFLGPPPPQRVAGVKKAGRGRPLWFAGAAAVGLLALIPVGLLCSPTVVRIVTSKGVLVIEADDKAVELTVKGQGATIIDPRTKREVEVRAGDHEIEVRERPDGLHFFTKTFTLSRGGTEIVRVREEMAKARSAEAPAPKLPAAEVVNSLDMKLRLIRPGKFLMGSPKDEEGRADNEGPQHEVEITKPFYMAACLVTRGQFADFVKDAGYQTDAESHGKGGWCFNFTTVQNEQKPEYTWRHPGFPQTDKHPVVQVSWNDAQAFCDWLSRKEGKVYELPTEAEWEYACRAGTTTRYWCGHADNTLQGNANVGDASLAEKLGADTVRKRGWTYATWNDGYPYTSPVGAFKANPWGLYDMGGNVVQWCADYYGPYPGGSIKDPTGPENLSPHLCRGGCWNHIPRGTRSAVRWTGWDGGDSIGFRIVMRPLAGDTPPPMPPPAGTPD
ncbi:MAG: SUMF1/EgtB/PvdO family nonheme iron enzyme [Planctomycetes bacterium]|nr:SUMF1/EgtB/PvdO family nonheme iron enzyme [Planctomycetota bacterium]